MENKFGNPWSIEYDYFIECVNNKQIYTVFYVKNSRNLTTQITIQHCGLVPWHHHSNIIIKTMFLLKRKFNELTTYTQHHSDTGRSLYGT